MTKRAVTVFIAILILFSSFVSVSENSLAVDADHLRICEVAAAGSFEAVTIYNGNDRSINMKDYYLDDREGTLRFTSDIPVPPKSKITFVSDVPEGWFSDRNMMIYGTGGVISKNFVLADDGDEITLCKVDGSVIDALVYGNGDIETDGWSENAFRSIPKHKMAVRSSIFDTDTAADWKLSVAGRTDQKATSGFEAEVIPFVFPDSSGDPLFSALQNARSEIVISVYLLDHHEIASLLSSLMKRGVSVKILLEGSPAGGIPSDEISLMTALSDDGADVRFIKSSEGYKRYDMIHNKYAVIDSVTVVVTSENWRESAFTGNRGWGSVINSREYASYMHDIFVSDFDGKNDIYALKELYPSYPFTKLEGYNEKSVMCQSYNATVYPMISPDYSYDYLNDQIKKATERVYSQQMSLDTRWADITAESPVSWMESAASEGVDARLLLDTTFENIDSTNTNQSMVSMLNERSSVKAKTMNGGDGFSLSHNKGMIIDDTVWVSSINWTVSSFNSNREAAVGICSKDVAEFFASYFLLDWGDLADSEISLSVNVSKDPKEGEPVVMDASPSVPKSGLVFEWDLDSDGDTDRTGSKIAVVMVAGINECVLIATDGSGNQFKYDFTVTVASADVKDDLLSIKYLPVIIIFVGVLILTVISRIWRRKG